VKNFCFARMHNFSFSEIFMVGDKIEKPKKALFRQRAHCNPLSDALFPYPLSPDHVDWAQHYPSFYPEAGYKPEHLVVNTSDHPVEYSESPVDPSLNRIAPSILDIGCGFGGLLLHLSALFPDNLSLGMEIRSQVSNYVGERIRAARVADPPSLQNASVIRTNSMKYLVNYIRKGQCDKLFFCFADPHFKKANERRRILNDSLMPVYGYCLKPGGILYFITDVKDLYDWMEGCCERASKIFERIPQEELDHDPVIPAMVSGTEEGMKVQRNGQPAYYAAYRRLPE
jgi:tRNA (guanine-N7-)-methyltransferase